jgi:phosphatidylglycerophosphate synthase
VLGKIIILPIGKENRDISSFMRLHKVGSILTYIRIPLGLLTVISVIIGSWSIAASLVVLFVVLDVVDGRFARLGGIQDTAKRRAVDATADKLSVHACAASVCFSMPEVLYLWVPLVIRDLAQGVIAGRALINYRVVIAGAPWHRLFSLSMAVWGVYMLVTRNPGAALAAIAFAIGVFSLIDYGNQTMLFTKREREVHTELMG